MPDEPQPVDTSEEDRKTVAAVMRRIKEASDYRAEHVREYEVIKRLARGLPERTDLRGGRGEPGKTRANVGNLEMRRCIHSVASGVDAIVFGDEPFFEPYDPDLDDQSIEQMYQTKALLDKGHEQMDLRSLCTAGIKSGLTYGKLAVEVGWQVNRRWRLEKRDDGTTVDREVIDSVQPFMRVIPPWRYYRDPTVKELSEASWAGQEMEMSREQLEAMIEYAASEGGKVGSLDELSEAKGGSSTTIGQEVSERIQQRAGLLARERNTFSVISYWGRHPTALDPNDRERKRKDPRVWWIVVVNENRLAIEMLNPYHHGRIPYLEWKVDEEEEGPEATGIGQALKLSQILVNEDESRMEEMLNFGLYGVWQRTGALAGNMARVVRVFPGRILDQVLDGLMERIPLDVAPFKIGQAMLAARIEAMRAASGATTNVQAIPAQGTATEFRGLAAEAARRLATYATGFANQILRRFIEMELELYDQFLPGEEPVMLMLPMEERMVTLRVPKESLRLRGARVRMKVATDLDFRRSMTRNMNQTIQQLGGIIGTIASAAQSAGTQAGMIVVEALSALLPSILQIAKKQLIIYGQSPAQVMPDGLARRISERLQIGAQQAQAIGAQQALSPEGPPGAGAPPPQPFAQDQGAPGVAA